MADNRDYGRRYSSNSASSSFCAPATKVKEKDNYLNYNETNYNYNPYPNRKNLDKLKKVST